MQKNKYQIAREIIEQYNKEYLQWETFLHVHEWLDEQAKIESKKEYLKVDDQWNVIDIDKQHFEYCESCWSKIKYHKVSFSKTFVPVLQKILDYVVDWKKNTWEHKNLIDIKDINLTHSEYTHINKIANFGLLYRETTEDWKKIKNGTYWVPQKRIFDFLNWYWKVAKFYVVKSTTHERSLSKARIFICELPETDGWLEYKTKKMPWYIDYIDHNNIW